MYSCINNLHNYVVPAEMWHMSDGKSLNPAYMKTLEIMIDRYGTYTDYFNTTVRQWKTTGVSATLYRKYYYLKQILKRILIRK